MMILRREIVLALVKNLNYDDTASKRLNISHLDDTGLYAATTEQQPILIKAAIIFVKNRNKQALFHALPFYTNAETFVGS